MTSTLRREVAFPSDGVTCRAWAYIPDERVAHPAPCIVMAHGLGGTRNASLEPYAERFVRSGFFVVLFDYRYLGDSDGEPRQLISIARQLEDWAAAIAFARSMPDVDAARIALWGCSLSGGHVMVAAARDHRIAAISAQCPMLDGAASSRMVAQQQGYGTLIALASAALTDVTRATLGQSPYYVPLIAPPGELAAMSTTDAYTGCSAIVPPGWPNEVAARLFFSLPLYRPVRYAGAVECPALLITCEKDTVVSSRAVMDAATRMGSKARLVSLPIGHFEIYLGEWLERSSAEQIAFFKDVLLNADTGACESV